MLDYFRCMKNFALIVCIAFGMHACTPNSSDKFEQAEKLYKQAEKLSDPNTMVTALNQILLLDPNNIQYKDSLCRIYLKGGNPKGGLILAEELMDTIQVDNKMLELVGVAYQETKDLDKAGQIFNELFSKTTDYRYMYQVAAIAYEMNNRVLFDSLTNKMLNETISDSAVARTFIDFPGPLSGAAQYVPLAPATLFLKGKYAMDKMQDLGVAQAYYTQALGQFENFELPYYYLQQIEEYRKGMR